MRMRIRMRTSYNTQHECNRAIWSVAISGLDCQYTTRTIAKATNHVHTGLEMAYQHEDQSGRAGAKHRESHDRRRRPPPSRRSDSDRHAHHHQWYRHMKGASTSIRKGKARRLDNSAGRPSAKADCYLFDLFTNPYLFKSRRKPIATYLIFLGLGDGQALGTQSEMHSLTEEWAEIDIGH